MTQTGRERLTQYLERSKQKQYELAGQLGITESYLSQVLSGRRRPGLDIAVRIETETGIPVSSWSDSKRGGLGAGEGESTATPVVAEG